MGILLPQITCLPGSVHKPSHPALEELGGGAFLHLLFDLQCPDTPPAAFHCSSLLQLLELAQLWC